MVAALSRLWNDKLSFAGRLPVSSRQAVAMARATAWMSRFPVRPPRDRARGFARSSCSSKIRASRKLRSADTMSLWGLHSFSSSLKASISSRESVVVARINKLTRFMMALSSRTGSTRANLPARARAASGPMVMAHSRLVTTRYGQAKGRSKVPLSMSRLTSPSNSNSALMVQAEHFPPRRVRGSRPNLHSGKGSSRP